MKKENRDNFNNFERFFRHLKEVKTHTETPRKNKLKQRELMDSRARSEGKRKEGCLGSLFSLWSFWFFPSQKLATPSNTEPLQHIHGGVSFLQL